MFRPWLQTIDRNKRILEIGPLANPMIQKDPNMDNVYYADIRSTEEVKEFYKNDNSVDNNNIVSIDYVIKNSYSEGLKNVEPFDYVIMSHVLEHIPDIIDFFKDIANVLKPDGKLCLTIPDKRYCFDHYRQPTSFAECYDVYRRSVHNNPLRVLDFLCSTTINDPVFWWKNPTDYEQLGMRKNSLGRGGKALDVYESALKGIYHDVHFSVFTPESFLLLAFFLTKCALFPFKIFEFYGTEENTFEFNVVLEKHSILLDNTEENDRVSDSILVLLSDNSDNKALMFQKELADKLQMENIQLQETPSKTQAENAQLLEIVNKMQAENTQLQDIVNKTQIESQKLLEEKMRSHHDLDAILGSKSWRITKPLRFLLSVVRKVMPWA